MEFEVYCDESMPDLFTSKHLQAQYLLIGSLWLPSNLRQDIKTSIQGIRAKYKLWGEIKWTKVSPSNLDFYLELVDLFFDYQLDLRFRCIAVDSQQFNLSLHNNDSELGFYKFYYQLLYHWIDNFNEYSIYCDTKTNNDPKRLSVLKKCLIKTNLSSTICNVQALHSKSLVLIQLCDLLLGAAGSRINRKTKIGSAKEQVIKHLEKRLNVLCLIPTTRESKKFNIFCIRLQGGL